MSKRNNIWRSSAILGLTWQHRVFILVERLYYYNGRYVGKAERVGRGYWIFKAHHQQPGYYLFNICDWIVKNHFDDTGKRRRAI